MTSCWRSDTAGDDPGAGCEPMSCGSTSRPRREHWASCAGRNHLVHARASRLETGCPPQRAAFWAFPFGLAGGRYGWDLSAAGPEAAVDFALDELAGMFGSGVRKNLVKSHAAGWADKPSTLGAYAAAMPGHYSARVEFARPAGDRICFVGEAVAMSRVQLYDRSVHRPYGWRDDAMRTLSGWSSLRGRPAVHR